TAGACAERNCLSATVPPAWAGCAHARRRDARAIVDLARGGHERAERNEGERLVLPRLAIVRRALAGALGRRYGRSTHLRKDDRVADRRKPGWHDRRLGPASLRIARAHFLAHQQ